MDYQGIATLLASITASVVALVTRWRTRRISENVQKIELATNSMKDALVEATREKSLLEGANTERADEAARKALKAKGLSEGPIV